MERDAFLNGLSKRLGREQVAAPSARVVIGVSDGYQESPFGKLDVPQYLWPERFRDELHAIGGTAYIANSLDEASQFVRELASTVDRGLIVTWARQEFAGWDVDFLWDELGAVGYCLSEYETEADNLRQTINCASVGITTVDFAVVNSGTLALYTNQRRNRSVSLLPATHVALVRESQLTPRLGGALPCQDGSRKIPSSVHYITGPSRSADIENDLTIGVHGPAALTVIICRGL